MVLKQAIKGWLPPQLLQAAHRTRERLKFALSADKGVLAANRALQGQGAGRRAFLLATGPSLKMEKLSRLRGEDCFGVSNFFLHPEAARLKPKLHFFASYHAPLVEANFVAWLRLADRRLPRATGIVTTLANRSLVEKNNLFKRRPVHFLYESAFPSRCSIDLERPVLRPQTVPLLALPVLAYMGYESVGLLGCDHTTLRDYKRPIAHFFKQSRDPRKNASDVASWPGIEASYAEGVRTFEQYRFYESLLAKSGTKIINYSKDSWLDFFEQGDLRSLT
jgi:hypothetical protein